MDLIRGGVKRRVLHLDYADTAGQKRMDSSRPCGDGKIFDDAARRAAADAVDPLRDWAEKNLKEVLAAQRRYDAQHAERRREILSTGHAALSGADRPDDPTHARCAHAGYLLFEKPSASVSGSRHVIRPGIELLLARINQEQHRGER